MGMFINTNLPYSDSLFLTLVAFCMLTDFLSIIVIACCLFVVAYICYKLSAIKKYTFQELLLIMPLSLATSHTILLQILPYHDFKRFLLVMTICLLVYFFVRYKNTKYKTKKLPS